MEHLGGVTDLHKSEVVLISAIEHYAYCPRQCALIHLDSVFEDNVHTTQPGAP